MFDYPLFVTWSVTILIIAIGIFLQLEWLKIYVGEWKLNKLLKNTGLKSLHNVSISDGVDEKIFIEHLILTPNNILLLGVKKFRGLIFAAKKINLWTQVLGKKSYKFENPLHKLENDISVLNTKIENTKIEGKILFINGSEFPKGKPDDVITISDVKSWTKKDANTEIPTALLNDWNQLAELAVSNDLDKGVLIDDGKSSFKLFSLVVTIVAVLLWFLWRLKL